MIEQVLHQQAESKSTIGVIHKLQIVESFLNLSKFSNWENKQIKLSQGCRRVFFSSQKISFNTTHKISVKPLYIV